MFLFSFPTYYLIQTISISSVLFRFCWAESYVDFLLPATECKLNIWTTEAASETEERERERERWPSQGHLLLDVLKLWNSERICTSLVSPRTFFLLHTYTHLFPHKTLLEWQLPFLDHTNFYLNNEKKKVKEPISNLLTMTNPAELLKGIWMSKVQQEQNFLKTE